MRISILKSSQVLTCFTVLFLSLRNVRSGPEDLLENARKPVLLNSQQLALGYNSMLGLLPHEQEATHMRRPILKFHLNREHSFVQLQTAMTLVQPVYYATPFEYYVSSEQGGCEYSIDSSSNDNVFSSSGLSSVSAKYSQGLGTIKMDLNRKGAKESSGVSEAKVGASTELGLSVGNSRESSEAFNYARQGYTQMLQTYIKRIYYTAGLRTDVLSADSFTDEFKTAAFNLANGPYNFTVVSGFIHTWGNFLFDSVQMGAMRSVNSYFSSSTSIGAINRDKSEVHESNTNLLYQQETTNQYETSSSQQTQNKLDYYRGSVHRVGEFATADGNTDELCRIGNSIVPKIVGFNLLPLWDRKIPLETFLNSTLADTFREYIESATNNELDRATTCSNSQNQNCTSNGGLCVPMLENQIDAVYALKCLDGRGTEPPSGTPTMGEEYKFHVYLLNDKQNNQITILKNWGIPDPDNGIIGTVKASDGPKNVKAIDIVIASESNETYMILNSMNIDRCCDEKFRYKDCSGPGGDDNYYDNCIENIGASYVICPEAINPLDPGKPIPEDMCYRIFYGYWHDVPGRTGFQVYFTVSFVLSKYSPKPLRATYTPYQIDSDHSDGQTVDQKCARSGTLRPGIEGTSLRSSRMTTTYGVNLCIERINHPGGNFTTNPELWYYPKEQVNEDQKEGGSGPFWNEQPRYIHKTDQPTVAPTPRPTPSPSSAPTL